MTKLSLNMYRVLGYGTVYCTQSGGSIFFQNTKVTCIFLYNIKVPCILLYNKGGGEGCVPKGPKSQKCVQMCIRVCTFVS